MSADQTQSVVLVFHEQYQGNQWTVYPRGLIGSASYSVYLLDAGTMYEASGQDIMTNGIALNLPDQGSEIIDISQSN